jgi:predicted DNA-binding transcriptional regulator AlpA
MSVLQGNERVRRGHDASNLPALMTVQDVARLMTVSKRTVWRMRNSGAVPRPVKILGAVRWKGSDIRQWLDAGCPSEPMAESTQDEPGRVRGRND